MMRELTADVVIIGGGPAGMSAALMLARARKRVVVLDAEQPRHGIAEGVHNLLSREGINPWELRRVSRAQILEYPGVRFEHAQVTRVVDGDDQVEVHTAAGEVLSARAALLAIGIRDKHPSWPGWEQAWGKSANQCPYCHGWESRDKPLAAIVNGPRISMYATLLRAWSADVMVFADGQDIAQEDRDVLALAQIPIKEGKIVALHQQGGLLEAIELEGGERVARGAAFRHQTQEPVELVRAMGLEMDNAFIKADMWQKTSGSRVWAAGDCTTMMQTVAHAMDQGMRAAGGINMTLTTPSQP
jgi:thioredoxin reductase